MGYPMLYSKNLAAIVKITLKSSMTASLVDSGNPQIRKSPKSQMEKKDSEKLGI
jgi:hypothetical protein